MPLTEAAATLRGSLYTSADADDGETLDALNASGFAVELVMERFDIRFDRALTMLERARVPSGFSIHPADAVDEERLFTLDNTIRQDTPGTDGWRGDRQWFHEELSDAPPFDPTAYLVAVDNTNGEYVGLIRIWRNPTGPRFGLIGVIRQYRNTPIGAALLRQALSAASHWGESTFTTETSPGNQVIYPRMKRLGAESLGQFFQLVRRGT